MKEITCGTATSDTIRFMPEEISEAGEFICRGSVEVKMTERDWDVTDPEARAAAAREELGEGIDHWWSVHSQWFINAKKNAAAFIIFRRKTPENLKAWERRTGQGRGGVMPTSISTFRPTSTTRLAWTA